MSAPLSVIRRVINYLGAAPIGHPFPHCAGVLLLGYRGRERPAGVQVFFMVPEVNQSRWDHSFFGVRYRIQLRMGHPDLVVAHDGSRTPPTLYVRGISSFLGKAHIRYLAVHFRARVHNVVVFNQRIRSARRA